MPILEFQINGKGQREVENSLDDDTDNAYL
jgi:hypothetical protein